MYMNNLFINTINKNNSINKIFINILLLFSTKDKNLNVHIITENNIKNYIKIDENKIKNIELVKYLIIDKYTGIWIESNILLFESLNKLLNKKNFLIKKDEQIITDIFLIEKNNNLLKNLIITEEDINIIYKTKNFLFKNIEILDYNNELLKIFNQKNLENINYDKNFFENNLEINKLINKSFNNLDHLDDIDFIEIGTSHFETLIQESNDNIKGISIDPIKYYLDKLPNKLNVKKLQLAISNIKKKGYIYYIPHYLIKKLNLPEWYYGCNKLDDYHPYHIKNNLKEYVEKEEIEVISIIELLYKNKIKKIKYLKIDTEGHDCIILENLYEYIKYLPKKFYPDIIIFESQMTEKKNVDNIKNKFINIDYKIIKDDWDIIMIL